MVHALEEIRRLLNLDGVLINILPGPEGYFIEVHHDGRILFAERKRETFSEDVLQAKAAIQQVLDWRRWAMSRSNVVRSSRQN